MKKIVYLIGALVSIAAICAAIAIILKKLRVSLAIEGVDEIDEENGDIDVSVEDGAFDETADAVEEALEEILSEETGKDIDVEINEL